MYVAFEILTKAFCTVGSTKENSWTVAFCDDVVYRLL